MTGRRQLCKTVSLALASLVTVFVAGAGEALAKRESCRVGTRIVGGERAKITNWPGQASLRLYSKAARKSEHFCGGTAVSRRWVLTAAHCLHDLTSGPFGSVSDDYGVDQPARFEVVIGVDDLGSVRNSNTYPVEKVVLHPDYAAKLDLAEATGDTDAADNIAPTIGQDLALVRLARDYDGPVAVLAGGPAASAIAARPGQRVRVSGFGKTTGAVGAASLKRVLRSREGGISYFAGNRHLLETSISTIAQSQCRTHHGNAYISENQICAGLVEGGQDSCTGDSGGPLVAYDSNACPYQIGVVSWGDRACGGNESLPTAYGVYTNVSAFSDWIQSHTGPLTFAALDRTKSSIDRMSNAEITEGLAQLAELLGDARGNVEITISAGQRVRLGEKVAFQVRSEVDGRLALIDINASGEALLIFPNRYVRGNAAQMIAAGTSVRVPGAGYGFSSFQAVEPAGKSRLIALVVPKAFDITRFLAPPEVRTKGFVPVAEPTTYFMRFIQQIRNYLTRNRRSGQDATRDWAFGVIDYEIVR